jgi:hypothetical protein
VQARTEYVPAGARGGAVLVEWTVVLAPAASDRTRTCPREYFLLPALRESQASSAGFRVVAVFVSVSVVRTLVGVDDPVLLAVTDVTVSLGALDATAVPEAVSPDPATAATPTNAAADIAIARQTARVRCTRVPGVVPGSRSRRPTSSIVLEAPWRVNRRRAPRRAASGTAG